MRIESGKLNIETLILEQIDIVQIKSANGPAQLHKKYFAFLKSGGVDQALISSFLGLKELVRPNHFMQVQEPT